MPIRTFQDPSGAEWEVFEVHRRNDRPTAVRPALSAGWLAFVSGQKKRRLPQYPSDWIELKDDELYELLGAAFVVVHPASSSARTSGSVSPSIGEARERRVERRSRPRLSSQAPTVPLTGLPDLEVAVTSASTPADMAAEGHPVARPPTITGVLGSKGTEELIRGHARHARQNGVSVIEGMILVKRALGEDVTRETIKQHRKVFVEEFYSLR